MLPQRKPTHPGVVLREDVLRPLGLTVTEAAENQWNFLKSFYSLPFSRSTQ